MGIALFICLNPRYNKILTNHTHGKQQNYRREN